MTQKRDMAWLAALWAAATAYNLTKPYHIDDAAHLIIAQWIAAHPLHPMRGLLNWTSTPEPIWATNQPHLYFYALAAWGSLFGWSEMAMHVLQSFFTGACILLMYRLARRTAPAQALFLTALLALNPAFFVEQNLMVDVPLLAAWLWFFTALLEERFALAGLACAVALLMKYSSLCLLPVLVLAPLLARRPAALWSLAIPAAALAAWSGFNWWDYGGIHLLSDFHASGLTTPMRPHHFWFFRHIVIYGDAWLLAAGALCPFGITALEGRGLFTARIYPACALGLFLLAAGVALHIIPGELADVLIFAGCAGNGVALMLLLQPPRGQDSRVLWLWVVLTSLFYISLAPFIAARHILLILPPLTVLAARNLQISSSARVFALGLSAVLSLGLGASDYQFAAFYRSEAASIAAGFPGQRITVAGHWGLQYYAALQGMPELDILHPPPPGSILVIAPDVDHGLLPHQPMALLRTDTGSFSPLGDPFCTARPVRFYASYAFYGPWSLSAACTQTIDIYRIK